MRQKKVIEGIRERQSFRYKDGEIETQRQAGRKMDRGDKDKKETEKRETE